jgi:hypothetical protein
MNTNVCHGATACIHITEELFSSCDFQKGTIYISSIHSLLPGRSNVCYDTAWVDNGMAEILQMWMGC